MILAIIDTLRYCNWHRALNHILFRSLCWRSYSRFGSPILNFLLFKIVHAVDIYSVSGQLLYRFTDKTLIILRGLLSCALLTALVGKSAIPCDIQIGSIYRTPVITYPVIFVNAVPASWGQQLMLRCIEIGFVPFKISVFRYFGGFTLEPCFEVHFINLKFR